MCRCKNFTTNSIYSFVSATTNIYRLQQVNLYHSLHEEIDMDTSIVTLTHEYICRIDQNGKLFIHDLRFDFQNIPMYQYEHSNLNLSARMRSVMNNTYKHTEATWASWVLSFLP